MINVRGKFIPAAQNNCTRGTKNVPQICRICNIALKNSAAYFAVPAKKRRQK